MPEGFGRLTHFNSSLIIMTSNLGVRHTGGLGFNASAAGEVEFRKAVMDFFRPEFFNRMDGIVLFAPLPPDVAQPGDADPGTGVGRETVEPELEPLMVALEPSANTSKRAPQFLHRNFGMPAATRSSGKFTA
jgi:hypothetical protein